jgi:hypothetical protein
MCTKRFARVVQEKSNRLATNGNFRSASCGWIVFGIRPSQTNADLEASILSTFHRYITDWRKAGYNGEVQQVCQMLPRASAWRGRRGIAEHDTDLSEV